MSYTRAYTLWCEDPACAAWIGNEDSLAAARRAAKRAGWEHQDGKDFCAGHKAAPEPYDGRDGARLRDVHDWKPWHDKQATVKVGTCSYCGESVVIKT